MLEELRFGRYICSIDNHTWSTVRRPPLSTATTNPPLPRPLSSCCRLCLLSTWHLTLKSGQRSSSHRRGSPRSTRSQAKVCTDTVTGRSKASIDATGAFHVSLFTPLAHLPFLPLPLANFTPRPSPTLLPLRFPLLLQCALDILVCGSSCSSLACVASLCRTRHRKSR